MEVLLVKILGSVLIAAGKAGGKAALKHFLSQTPAQKAIKATAADFPSNSLVKDALSRWCQSDEFLRLFETLNNGQIESKAAEETIINSFIEVGLFHDGVINTHRRASSVLQRFAEHLEAEVYKSEQSLLVEARRAKNRHEETQNSLKGLSEQTNLQFEEVKTLIQEQIQHGIPTTVRTEIIKSLDRFDQNSWQREADNIRNLLLKPHFSASLEYAEPTLFRESHAAPTKNLFAGTRSINFQNFIVTQDFVGREAILTEIQNFLPETRFYVVTGFLGAGKSELLKRIASQLEQNAVFWYEFQPGLINSDNLVNRLLQFLFSQGNKSLQLREAVKNEHSEFSLQDKINAIIEGLNESRCYLFFDRINQTAEHPIFHSFFAQLKEQLQNGTVFFADRAAPAFLSIKDELNEKVKHIALEGLDADEIEEFFGRRNITISNETAAELEINLNGLPLALELLQALAASNANDDYSEEMLLEFAEKAKERIIEHLFDEVYARLEAADKDLLTTAALLSLPFAKNLLLSAHKTVIKRSAAANFQKLQKQSLIKKYDDVRYQTAQIIADLAVEYAEIEIDERRIKLAEYLFEEAADDVNAQLETVLLYIKSKQFDFAAETVLSIMERDFIVYSPDLAELLVELFEEYKVNPQNWMWMLGEKGRIADYWRDFESAEKHYQAMLEAARKLSDKKAEAIALLRLGIATVDRDSQLAERYYLDCRQLLIELNDLDGQADVNCNLGLLYTHENNFEQAETFLLNALELHEKNNSPDWQMLGVISNLGILYANQKKWNEAFEQSRRALQIAEDTKSPYHIAKAVYNLATHEKQRSNAAEAQKLYREVLETAMKYDFWDVEELVRTALGLLFADLKNFPEAITNFKKAFEIREEIEDYNGATELLFDIGTFYLKAEDFDSALDYYRQGVSRLEHIAEDLIDLYLINVRLLARKLQNAEQVKLLVGELRLAKKRLINGNRFSLSRVLHTLGDIYLEVLERQKQAFLCFRGEIKALGELGRAYEQAVATRNLAYQYQISRQFGEAINLNREAEQLAESHQLIDLLPSIRYNTGNCYAEVEMPAQAEKFYLGALENVEANDDSELESLIRHNLGEVLRRQGKSDEAIEQIERSLQFWRNNNDYSGEVGALNNLGLAYQEQGNLNKSAECFERASQLAEEHFLYAQQASALISLGNIFQDDHTKARRAFERALSAASLSEDKEMEEGAMLSLAYAHRELGTFSKIEAEFEKIAERASELEHYENLTKMLVLSGEIELEKSSPETAAEMFEKGFFFAFLIGVESIKQFQNHIDAPFHFREMTHVLTRLLIISKEIFEKGDRALLNAFYENLKNKIQTNSYWAANKMVLQFIEPLGKYLEETPEKQIEEYVFDAWKEFEVAGD